jgi:hypothetical protein
MIDYTPIGEHVNTAQKEGEKRRKGDKEKRAPSSELDST